MRGDEQLRLALPRGECGAIWAGWGRNAVGCGRTAPVMTAMGSRTRSVQGSRIESRRSSVDPQKVSQNTADLDRILDYGDDLYLAAALGADERVQFIDLGE